MNQTLIHSEEGRAKMSIRKMIQGAFSWQWKNLSWKILTESNPEAQKYWSAQRQEKALMNLVEQQGSAMLLLTVSGSMFQMFIMKPGQGILNIYV